MRSSVAARLSKAVSSFCAVVLCCGLIPSAAFAADPSLSLIPEGGEGAAPIVSDAEGGGAEAFSHYAADAGPSVDGGSAAIPSEDADDTARDAGASAAPNIVSEEHPLIARAESTRSFFLAQTLESTRTVPMVSAKLPIDDSADGEGTGSEGVDPEEGVLPGSTVVGAFEQDGMTFAIEADGSSVALMALDYAKLPREFVEKQVVAIPEIVSPDGIDSYGVARIADGALSSLKKENADPAFAGCAALFSDEELLAEADIDPSEVEGFLSDEGSATQDEEGADVPSDAQAGTGTGEDGSDPSAEEDSANDPDSSVKLRTIVSVDGNIATLDDGSTYEFENPLTGCTGILALGIGASVTQIEDDAFEGSDTLQYLVVSEDNPTYASFDGALYDADLSELLFIPEGRVGAVCVAADATELDLRMFSHRPRGDVFVIDRSNASLASMKGHLLAGEISALTEILRSGFSSYRVSEAKSLGWESTESSTLFGGASRSGIYMFYLKSNIPFNVNFILFENAAISVTDVRSSSAATDFHYYGEGIESWTSHAAHVQCHFSDPNYWRDLYPFANGYSFQGFFYDSAYTSNVPVDTYHPQWGEIWCKFVPITYVIAYDDAGGSFSGKTGSYTIENADIKLPTSGTRTGYTFGGWDVTGAAGVGIVGNGTTNVTVKKGTYGNLTAKAKWTPITYSIAYDDAGGSFSGKTTSYTIEKADFKLPMSGTRAGYTFAGWDVTGASGSGVTGNGMTDVTIKKGTYGNLTAKAKWTPVTYTVTYNDAGGSFTDKTGSYTIETSDFVLPTSGTRTGYTFAGWDVVGASGVGITGDGTTNVTVKKGTYGNLTATAKWTANTYAVSFDSNGGSGGQSANVTATYDAAMPTISTTKPTRAGYTFEGWYDTSASSGGTQYYTAEGASARVWDKTAATTLYARWSANPYTAYLHTNDGTDTVIEHGVTYDATVLAASVPKRYGYVFSGYWTKEADGTKGEMYFDEDGAYVKGDVWRDVTDVDLHACWTLMANLEVPINAPGTVTLGVDRATVIGEDASGTQVGPNVTGSLRSAVPQEVPLASVELEPLKDDDGTASASRILGEGNPERCAVEVSLGSSDTALLRLADPTGISLRWEPAFPLVIPAAMPVAADATGDDLTTDVLGNLARTGELSLSYAMKLLPGFDVYEMPTEDATSEPIARIVFTVDLTGLVQEAF